jgi:hypothetical protein
MSKDEVTFWSLLTLQVELLILMSYMMTWGLIAR